MTIRTEGLTHIHLVVRDLDRSLRFYRGVLVLDRPSRLQRREEEGVYDVHDWAEVRRLYHREHLSKAAIARRLGMSRPTVIRLLELGEPPRYERRSTGSKLDPHKDAITAMLDEDATVAATVILEHLRRDGYAGGITIVKDHVARVRPAFLAARSYRRTTLSPGRARPRRL